MVRIERGAVFHASRKRRPAGPGHFTSGSDTEQAALASAVRDALAHDFHDARLRAAVDDQRLGIRRRAGDAAAQQLRQAGGQLFVQLVRSADEENHVLGGRNPECLDKVICRRSARRHDQPGAIVIWKEDFLRFYFCIGHSMRVNVSLENWLD